jgi:hypothetical protein
MKLKEDMKKEIEEMDVDELLFLYEQIRLFRKGKKYPESKYTLEEIIERTSTSKLNWSDDVSNERLAKSPYKFKIIDNYCDDKKVSTAQSLLKFAGTWAGNDAEKVLKRIIETRSKTEF